MQNRNYSFNRMFSKSIVFLVLTVLIFVGAVFAQSPIEVEGSIRLGSDNSVPVAGQIRWDSVSQDFEGYDGNQWVSFTSDSSMSQVLRYNFGMEIVGQKSKIMAEDGDSFDYFGCSVARDGDYLVVGANADEENGDRSGSAYIFKQNDIFWVEQDKLLSNVGDEFEYFGSSVGISGDYVVIGAPGNDSLGPSSGAAYVFKRDSSAWTQQAILLPDDGQPDDEFGRSVAISGNTIIVGSYLDDDNGPASGSAYIFNRINNSWFQEDKIIPVDGDSNDLFGSSVAIFGDYVIIGVYQDEDNGIDSGSAYIFQRDSSSWVERAKLLPSDGEPGAFFGVSVDIFDDYVVIGASSDDHIGAESGSAYVFKRDNIAWSQQSKLVSTDRVEYQGFGNSVSIFENFVVVGAIVDHTNGSKSGSAYIFQLHDTSWYQMKKFLPNDGMTSGYFGVSVSIYDGQVIIGSRGDDDNGSSSGSVYIY